MTTSEAQRQRDYERWLAGTRISGEVLRWAMGPHGQWAINTPLMKIHEHLRMQPDQRWLDIGCGRASLLRFIDSRVHFQHPPVGLDFARGSLALARRDDFSTLRPPALAQGAATALPFADETFEFVTCGYVIKHLEDDELSTFLAEVRRVLVGGGLAVLWEFAPSGSERLDSWNRQFLSAGVHDPQLRSTSTLLRMAREANYELIRNARLRPFLLPPMPRASIFIGKAPEGWAMQGT